jgi:glycerate-2-kinase
MRSKIINRQELLSSGDVASRTIVLDVLERTLCEMDSYKRLLKFVSFDGCTLRIGEHTWDLTKKRNVYLICGGKAANATGMALEKVLGNRLTKGFVIVKSLEAEDIFEKSDVFIGGHPLPNMEGYKACISILKLIEHATEDDLFISAISGGTSALMSCPIAGLTLEEEILATDIMLKSGANIHEINSIRRHISRINGGHLAQKIEEKGAEMILLMHSDAIGHPPTLDPGKATIITGGPMGPDPTTLQDAKNAIRNYNVTDKLPKTIVNFFKNCTEEDETPKFFKKHTSFCINTLPDICTCAKKVASEMGIPAIILTSSLTGSSKEAGKFMAALAREIYHTNHPFPAPCILIASGEVSTIIDNPRDIRGLGGPGQELAVSFAIAAFDIPGVCIASIDSEGTDGPTDAAGGLTDSTTFQYALDRGVNLHKALSNHSTYSALSNLGGLVLTGNTGTTLCDLHILYMPSSRINM